MTQQEPPTSLLNRSPHAGPGSARRAFSIATSAPVVLLGLRMSMVIGSVLNLINQGDALFGDAKLVPGKLLLTYLVPYCVATYSATSVTLRLSSS
jgi:hypothetical protein